MNPYYLMTLFYLVLAVLAALDTSLLNLSVLPALPGQRWLLVHIITLGVLVEFFFGLLPDLTAALTRQPRPAFRWHTWFLLNAGLILLFAGIPMVNAILITAGGTLIFIAAALTLEQLLGLSRRGQGPRSQQEKPLRKRFANSYSARFYITGLVYLLVGILVGTGIWLGWSGPLRIVLPKEVHVHSNLWGFTFMVLAGLLFDLFPAMTGVQLARPRLVNLTFWLVTLGALGLVLGPWIGVDSITVYGLVLHTAGAILMLFNVFVPVMSQWRKWSAGIWHLALAYIWFLLAVVIAPLVVAGGGAGAEVAGSGGPILIFAWILQIGYALIPYLFDRVFKPAQPAQLGGSWLSLTFSNIGSSLYWISLFLEAGRGILRGGAYLLWVISLLPIIWYTAAGLRGWFQQARALSQPTSKSPLETP